MHTPRSLSLFHFTRTLEILKSILKNGFFPRYSLEVVSWLKNPKHKRLAFPMVCFCDIPISRIANHVSDYGRYGLGMSRQWALNSGLNPVSYISGDNSFAQEYRGMIEITLDSFEGGKISAASILHVLSFLKPTTDIGENNTLKEYYQESEWRYVPHNKDIVQCMLEKDYHDSQKLDPKNEDAKSATINFSQQDIRYIFVNREADIPGLVDFIFNELKSRFTELELKILTTRIISLENIEIDV